MHALIKRLQFHITDGQHPATHGLATQLDAVLFKHRFLTIQRHAEGTCALMICASKLGVAMLLGSMLGLTSGDFDSGLCTDERHSAAAGNSQYGAEL